jgi:ribonuclease HI
LNPPLSDRYHLETDASLKPWDRKTDARTGGSKFLAGGGIVLRDPNLRVVETHSVRLGYVSDATRAEFLALLFGLRRAAGLDIQKLRVRNDNLGLIRRLSDPTPATIAESDSNIREIRAECSRFVSVQFVWVRSTHSIWRSDGVYSADFLARRAIGLSLRSR